MDYIIPLIFICLFWEYSGGQPRWFIPLAIKLLINIIFSDWKCRVPLEDMRCYSPNKWIYIGKSRCEQSTRKACKFDNTFETEYECLGTCFNNWRSCD